MGELLTTVKNELDLKKQVVLQLEGQAALQSEVLTAMQSDLQAAKLSQAQALSRLQIAHDSYTKMEDQVALLKKEADVMRQQMRSRS